MCCSENISCCRKFFNVAMEEERNFKQQQSMSAGPLNITQQITVPLRPLPPREVGVRYHKFPKLQRSKQTTTIMSAAFSLTDPPKHVARPRARVRRSAIFSLGSLSVCSVCSSAQNCFKLVSVMLVRAITPLWRASNRNHVGGPPEQPGTSAEWIPEQTSRTF